MHKNCFYMLAKSLLNAALKVSQLFKVKNFLVKTIEVKEYEQVSNTWISAINKFEVFSDVKAMSIWTSLS